MDIRIRIENLTIEELGTFQLLMQRIKKRMLQGTGHLYPVYESIRNKLEVAKVFGWMEVTDEERIFIEMLIIHFLDSGDIQKDDPIYQKLKSLREKLHGGR